MRYFIKLSYDGAGFSGWQFQPNAFTVQECLERTLTTLLRERVQVVGAGRTDSKVNAIGYVAHFDYDKVIDTSALGYKLNAILPRGIVIHSVWQDSPDLHARFSATRREYTYFLHRTKDPFIENHSYFCQWKLDVGAMNEAARLLLGTHDFRCFEKTGGDNRTSICTVADAFWAPYIPSHVALMGFPGAATAYSTGTAVVPGTTPVPGTMPSPACADSLSLGEADSFSLCGEGSVSPAADEGSEPKYLYFRIAADRFLRNMVRAVVGSLLEVGRGRRSIADFATLILPADAAGPAEGAPASRTTADGTPFRSLAGESVPGHALFLSRVDY